MKAYYCPRCGGDVPAARVALGRTLCLPCGEAAARRTKHTIVPMSKSNYVVVTDMMMLQQLNPKKT